jgi:hypothetical protein
VLSGFVDGGFVELAVGFFEAFAEFFDAPLLLPVLVVPVLLFVPDALLFVLLEAVFAVLPLPVDFFAVGSSSLSAVDEAALVFADFSVVEDFEPVDFDLSSLAARLVRSPLSLSFLLCADAPPIKVATIPNSRSKRITQPVPPVMRG